MKRAAPRCNRPDTSGAGTVSRWRLSRRALTTNSHNDAQANCTQINQSRTASALITNVDGMLRCSIAVITSVGSGTYVGKGHPAIFTNISGMPTRTADTAITPNTNRITRTSALIVIPPRRR